METHERSLWNRKYSEKSHTSLDPDPLLPRVYHEFLSGRPAGNVLDIAGGVGRHSLWLVQRGWRATLLDISDVGIGLAKKNAARVLVPAARELFTSQVADLNRMLDLGMEQYELVLVFFFLQRELFPALVSALKPGGLLLYKTYTTNRQRFGGGPSNPRYLLKPNELLDAFPSLCVLHYHEAAQEKAVAELVAQK
jgi:tellurite methyltransferase